MYIIKAQMFAERKSGPVAAGYEQTLLFELISLACTPFLPIFSVLFCLDPFSLFRFATSPGGILMVTLFHGSILYMPGTRQDESVLLQST